MCGICGYMQNEDIADDFTIQNMKNSILNRGKSDNNVYISKNVALGHTRLSIIDIEGGTQPMTRNICGNNYTIVYNGELYNTNALRNVLKTRGYEFKTASDTEVLLLMYIEFKEKMLKFINGIYAFAIYDGASLFLAKDRLGIKPLFYSITKDNTFIFSSEIKGILASGKVKAVMTKAELLELISLGPAHSPTKTYFKDIYELEAGHFAVFKDKKLNIKKYWNLEEKKLQDSDEEIISNVKELVKDSVARELVSDVGMSCMLSGGLDSSIISKIAVNKNTAFHTYSINYKNNDSDFTPNDYVSTKDSDYVSVMTNYLGSKHKEIIITEEELFESLYEATVARDAPGMADVDSSMYIFCREIEKSGEKVILSGECSDEIFGGYPWFYKDHLKDATGFPWALSHNLRENLVKEKILKKGQIEEYVTQSKEKALKDISHISCDKFENEFKDINYLTIKFFMNTLIERTDRMSMRHSLEVRVPYADHRIFEYVYNIDARLKLGLRNGSNTTPIEKYVLKEAFKYDIPSSITKRKKSPFPKTYSKKYLKMVEETLLKILDDPASRIHEILSKDYIKDLILTHGKNLKENLFGQLMTYPQTLAFIIQIEYWLSKYNIQIEL